MGSSLWKRLDPPGTARCVEVPEVPSGRIWAHPGGLLFQTNDEKFVGNLKTLKINCFSHNKVNVECLRSEDGRTIKACNFGQDEQANEAEFELLNEEEQNLKEKLKVKRQFKQINF